MISFDIHELISSRRFWQQGQYIHGDKFEGPFGMVQHQVAFYYSVDRDYGTVAVASDRHVNIVCNAQAVELVSHVVEHAALRGVAPVLGSGREREEVARRVWRHDLYCFICTSLRTV